MTNGSTLNSVSRRKQPVYRFSGAPSLDPLALREALAGARSVRLWRGGYLVFADASDEDVLADETLKVVSLVRDAEGPRIENPQALTDLIEALAVSEVSDCLCMCTGDAAVEFFDGDRTLIAVVRIDFPDRIQWPHWEGEAQLTDPELLRQWFATHYAVTG